MEDRSGMAPETWLVSAGRPTEPGRPLNAPIEPVSPFSHGGRRIYARDDGTETWESLEQLIGGLEGGPTVAFASGMAAAAAVLDLVPAGGTVVLPEDCYHGVSGLVRRGAATGRWKMLRLPLGDVDGWLEALGDADVAWLETISNPLLEVADLRRVCGAARRAGTLVAVDNTFATPLNQQPLALGADLVMHSVTKFVGGHSDLLAGTVTAGADDLVEALRERRVLAGATPGALEAYLAVRGARTLAARLRLAERSALVLAERLAAHPAVSRVRYPGLPGDSGHALAAEQLGGFGAVLAFELEHGDEAAGALCAGLRLIRHATSLGSVETTLEQRRAQPEDPPLPPGLIRLSVGIEHVDDLWADLEQALG